MSDDQEKKVEDSVKANPAPDANTEPENNSAPEANPAPAPEPENEIQDDRQSNINDDQLDDTIPEVIYPDEPRNKIKRGDEINITQKDPTMRQLNVGVGWDLRAFESDPLDLDMSIFLLDRDEETRMDEDFIFYNNPTDKEGSVVHHGDNRTGAGDGDDENVHIDLNALPYDITKISFVLSIYNIDAQDNTLKDDNFSMVKNVYFRLVNENSNHEIFRYELDEELTGDEGLLIGFLERIGAEWVFTAVGETVEGGLEEIASNYGILVAERVQS